MGFTTSLQKVFDFVYKTSFDNGLTEYEFDHVLVGNYDGTIIPNPKEVADYCYRSLPEINKMLLSDPAAYTSWFKIAFPKLESYLANNTSNTFIG